MDPDDCAGYRALLDIDSDESATAFLDPLYADMSERQKARVGRIFRGEYKWVADLPPCSSPVRPARTVRVRGGGRGIEDPHRLELYRLLAFADAAHDFHAKEAVFTKKPVELVPLEALRRGTGAELPPGLDLEIVPDTNAFVRYVASRPRLFGADNPLHKKDVLERFDTDAAYLCCADFDEMRRRQLASMVSKAGSRNNLLAAEAWCPFHETHRKKSGDQKEQVYVDQLSAVCAALRDWLSARGRTEFLVDNEDDEIARVMISAKYLTRNFHARHVLVGSSSDLPPNDWYIVSCDASYLDGGYHEQSQAVPEETGTVFRSEEPTQVTLGGLCQVQEGDGTLVPGFSFDVRSSGRSESFQLPTYQTEFSTATMRADILKALRRDPLADVSKELALKRSGDWGQVEHCHTNGRVFVTKDRTAALYAAYRGVRFVLVSRKPRADPDLFLQVVFMMGRP